MPTFSVVESSPQPDPVDEQRATASPGVGETRPLSESRSRVLSPPDRLSRDPHVIAPRTNERVAFLGSTGSGKTTLACHYLSQIKTTPLVLCDTKGDSVLNRFARAHGFYSSTQLVIPSAEHPKVIVHGPPDPAFWAPLFSAMFRLRRSVTYVDELSHLQTTWNDADGKSLRLLLTSGRDRGHGVWVATQRPSGVPMQAFSECDHTFAFRLSWPDDEDAVSRMLRTGGRFDSTQLPRFGFAYHTHGMPRPVIARAIVPLI